MKTDWKKLLKIGTGVWIAGIIVSIVIGILAGIFGVTAFLSGNFTNISGILLVIALLLFIVSLLLTGLVLPIILNIFGFKITKA
jgi:hypothetical protein